MIARKAAKALLVEDRLKNISFYENLLKSHVVLLCYDLFQMFSLVLSNYVPRAAGDIHRKS